MSTMYDALRRAEAERKKGGGELKGGSSSSSSGGENTKVMILLVAVVCVFAFAAYRIFGMPKPHAPAPATATAPSTAGSQPTVVIPAPTAPKVRAPGVYELGGVIDAGESSMAIVNDKLLKVGDSIDHLTLQKISPQEVEMTSSKDNSTVVLKLSTAH